MPITYLDVPKDIRIEEKNKLMKAICAALRELPKFMIFMQEYPLDRVAPDGGLNSDNKARVEAQKEVYRDEGAE